MYLKLAAALLSLAFMDASGCSAQPDQSADQTQSQNQETMQEQAVQQIGLPNIVNFREMRTLKMVEELADQAIPTYAYVFSPMKACFVYLGPSFGYPLPYATQFTNPQKLVSNDGTSTGWSLIPIAQADPNGLFKPAEAAGTWVLMRNPQTNQLQPQYIEDNVEAFTYKLPNTCSGN